MRFRGSAAIGILKTLFPKRTNSSTRGSLFQRELPNGVRDSIGSAAGEPAFLAASRQKLEAPTRSHAPLPHDSGPQGLSPSIVYLLSSIF